MQSAYAASQVTFYIDGDPITAVPNYLYLGRQLTYSNSDWLVLYRNLQRAQRVWGMIVRVLRHEGASTRAKGLFYKTIAQAVLLYSCETWTLRESMIKPLSGFHNRAIRRLTGTMPQRQPDNTWLYPPIAPAMKDAGIYSIQTYIWRRQSTAVDYIATRDIYRLCTEAAPPTGSSRCLRWWQQDHEPDSSYAPSTSSSDDSSMAIGLELDLLDGGGNDAAADPQDDPDDEAYSDDTQDAEDDAD